MEVKALKGRIEFWNKELRQYDCDFVATLSRMCDFPYSVSTSVRIQYSLMRNGRKPDDVVLDTRHVAHIVDRFKFWLCDWFRYNLPDCDVLFYD